MPILYSTPLSANGRKPMAVALHLGLSLEVNSVNVYRGDGRAAWYRKLNPWGKVPTLVDGDCVLWESNAIMFYLSEVLGDFSLSSHDPRLRADILRWMFWEASHWQPVLVRTLSARVSHYLFPQELPDAGDVDWSEPETLSLLAALEDRLSSNDYLAGGALSLADFAVAAMTTYFDVCEFPEHKYAAIGGWLQRMNALPGWAATAVAPWRAASPEQS